MADPEKGKTSKGFDWNAVSKLTDDQLLDALFEGQPDWRAEKVQASQKEEDYTIATPDGVIIAEVAHHDVSARPEPPPPDRPSADAPSVRVVDMRVRAVIPKDRPPDHGH